MEELTRIAILNNNATSQIQSRGVRQGTVEIIERVTNTNQTRKENFLELTERGDLSVKDVGTTPIGGEQIPIHFLGYTPRQYGEQSGSSSEEVLEAAYDAAYALINKGDWREAKFLAKAIEKYEQEKALRELE